MNPRSGKPQDSVSIGGIAISEEVFASIVRRYVLQLPEVARFASASFVSGLASIIGKRSSDRPIRVDIENDQLVIGVNVVLKFGSFVPAVAVKIQEVVKHRVEELTGKTVLRVDVFVCDLADDGSFKEDSSGRRLPDDEVHL